MQTVMHVPPTRTSLTNEMTTGQIPSALPTRSTTDSKTGCKPKPIPMPGNASIMHAISETTIMPNAKNLPLIWCVAMRSHLLKTLLMDFGVADSRTIFETQRYLASPVRIPPSRPSSLSRIVSIAFFLANGSISFTMPQTSLSFSRSFSAIQIFSHTPYSKSPKATSMRLIRSSVLSPTSSSRKLSLSKQTGVLMAETIFLKNSG